MTSNPARSWSRLDSVDLLRGLAIFFNISFRGLHLRLRLFASVVQSGGARLERSLPPSLLRAEHRRARLAQFLLIFGRARLSRRNVCSRLLDRTLRFAAPLRQHTRQRLVHNHGIEQIKERQQNYGGHRPEQ